MTADTSTTINSDRQDEQQHMLQTDVMEPRRRVFYPQSLFNRLRAFVWSVVRGTLFRWSLPFMREWRVVLLRMFGAKVGRNVYLAPTTRIMYPWRLKIGDDVVVLRQVIINCMGDVTIGHKTRISQYAHICAGTHDYRRRDMRIIPKPITIGEEVWVAADAFVGPGVTLGDRCLLAARSSAFTDLPADQVCIGEPARPRHARFDDVNTASPETDNGSVSSTSNASQT